MPTTTTPRKMIANAVRAASEAAIPVAEGLGEARVAADPTNPYAFAVEFGGKRFRVIVKEVG